MDTAVSFKIAKPGKLNGYGERNEGGHIRRGKYYRAVQRKEEVPNLSARPALQKMSLKKKTKRQAKHYGARLSAKYLGGWGGRLTSSGTA